MEIEELIKNSDILRSIPKEYIYAVIDVLEKQGYLLVEDI